MPKNESPFITTGERVTSFMAWAFVISLVFHAALGPLLPNLAKQNEQQDVEKVTVTKKIVVKVPTPPPPTPTPPPPTPPPKSTPQPEKQNQPKLKLNVVHTTSKGSSSASESKYVAPKAGSENGVPQGVSSGPPQPVSTAPVGTPKPACATPYQDATVVQQAQADYPDQARDLGLGEVQVAVQVTIGPTGNLVDATIAQSGGNMSLDRAAIAAARQSTYAPKIVNCQPVTGSYLFRVTFDPNS
jgi:protein TonB